MRIKISRKEAKESRYWLHLIFSNVADTNMKDGLIREATELIKIFSAILSKCGVAKY